jgi:orotidine-5'-phosphate decarboxylase
MSPAANAPAEIAVALDVDTLPEALELVKRIGPAVTWYKVGKQLYTQHGPETVRLLKNAGKKVFLDLKFHDIPNTVGQAVRAAAAVGADLTNVHASGGPEMLAAAAKAAQETGIKAIAVTVLTSMDAATLDRVGLTGPPEAAVVRLARLAVEAGAGGLVCSPLEVAAVRAAVGPGPLLVVPGVRPAGSAKGDQSRIATPAEAVRAGADVLVVGRPLRDAADPIAAARAIAAEL